ncbi:MAG: DMT family transporter [Pseudomonadota bacterium]
MELWIPFTLFAVVMQSVRMAGQKRVTQYLSVPAATLVRFLYGLPFAAVYCGFLHVHEGDSATTFHKEFFLWCSLAAVSQIIATVLFVKALQTRNFAVGTSLVKTEAFITSLIGSWFFDDPLNLNGYAAVLLGVTGVLIASKVQFKRSDAATTDTIVYGLGAGLGFALSALWLREGILSLAVPAIQGAAYALLFMVVLQTVLCFVWVFARQPEQLRLMRHKWLPCLFIGFTSVAGSIGWFTAMSMQNAALVRTLGQTEFLVALAITYYYFGESISRREFLGMLFVIVSVLLLLKF